MLVLLRIILGIALAYVVKLAHDSAQGSGAGGLFDSIFYVVIVVGLAIANAIVWAPYIGHRLSNALTGEGAPMPAAPPQPQTRLGKLLRLGVRLGGLALLVALGFWIWQYRALFDPIADLARAWRMGRAPWSVSEQSLTITRVIDSVNLQAKNEAGQLFTLRLAGLEGPRAGSYDPAVREQAQAGREFLQSLVLSNTVQVEVTLTNASRVMLAFVRVGETNVNAAALRAGHAEFREEYLGSASLGNRWALLQALRHTQSQP